MTNLRIIAVFVCIILLAAVFSGCVRINISPQLPQPKPDRDQTSKNDAPMTSEPDSADSTQAPSPDTSQAIPPTDKKIAFADIDWHHFDDPEHGECETLTFTSSGRFYYSCECGKPIENSALYSKYSYDETSGVITVSGDGIKARKIKVIGAGAKYLLLDIGGDIKCFSPAGSCLTEKYPIFLADKRMSDEYADDSTGLFKVILKDSGSLTVVPDGGDEKKDALVLKLERDCEVRILSFSRRGNDNGGPVTEQYYHKISACTIDAEIGSNALIWIDGDQMEIEEILFLNNIQDTSK